jgi:hypothetical protein
MRNNVQTRGVTGVQIAGFLYLEPYTLKLFVRRSELASKGFVACAFESLRVYSPRLVAFVVIPAEAGIQH